MSQNLLGNPIVDRYVGIRIRLRRNADETRTRREWLQRTAATTIAVNSERGETFPPSRRS